MNPNRNHAFVNQLLVYTLVMICFTGGVGLGTVWLRHQISLAANRSKMIKARIADVERHLAETKASVETEKGPDKLKQRNVEWRLGLVAPREPQVNRVSQDPVPLLAAKQDGGLADASLKPVLFHFPGN